MLALCNADDSGRFNNLPFRATSVFAHHVAFGTLLWFSTATHIRTLYPNETLPSLQPYQIHVHTRIALGYIYRHLRSSRESRFGPSARGMTRRYMGLPARSCRSPPYLRKSMGPCEGGSAPGPHGARARAH